MRKSSHPRLSKTSDRRWNYVRRAALAALLLICSLSTGFAQEPPLSVPASGTLPATPEDALTAGGWLFYPTVRSYVQYSDNLYQSVLSPISIWGAGINPSMIAEWSNGIHTSTLYGNIDARAYPSDNEFNVFDGAAGFAQKYSPLPDLTFRVQGDYTHKTVNSQFVNAIPGGFVTPGSTVLPNGNTVLPNGSVVNPAGVVVGQVAPTVGAAASQVFINPSNQFTGTASVEKILNRGFIGLSGSVSRTEYQNTDLTPDFTLKTLMGKASIWLGPVFYAYTDDAVAWYGYSNGTASTTHRVTGGIGTRQIGLFRAVAYYGHQGTSISGSGSAGGEVYGASLSYVPTPIWTITARVDETVNISTLTGTSNLALNNPTPSALIVPVTDSTRSTALSLNTGYLISSRWSAYGSLGYTHVEYLDSSRVDNAWLADFQLQYQMSRNVLLQWEYQYADILSNIPLNSSRQNFVSMSATYKF